MLPPGSSRSRRYTARAPVLGRRRMTGRASTRGQLLRPATVAAHTYFSIVQRKVVKLATFADLIALEQRLLAFEAR